MPVNDINANTLSIPAQINELGEFEILTAKGYQKPEKLGITISASASGGSGGSGGPTTIADGAAPTIGAKADVPATDDSGAWSQISLTKRLTSLLANTLGTKAPGAAANQAMLTGGVFNSTFPTLTNGQQVGQQVGSRGAVKIQIHGADNTPGMDMSSGHADSFAGVNGRLTASTYGVVFNGTTYDRMRGNTKGLYIIPGTPEDNSGNVPAQPVTGTSAASASLIAQIDNPGLRYKKLIINVTNNSAIAFTDFIIKTKCNPADSTYNTTYTADGYSQPAGYLQELSANPATLSNADGDCRIVLDISIFSSVQILATVLSAVPGTTATARWYMVAV